MYHAQKGSPLQHRSLLQATIYQLPRHFARHKLECLGPGLDEADPIVAVARMGEPDTLHWKRRIHLQPEINLKSSRIIKDTKGPQRTEIYGILSGVVIVVLKKYFVFGHVGP